MHGMRASTAFCQTLSGQRCHLILAQRPGATDIRIGGTLPLESASLLESCKQGCRLESENAQVSEKTNGTWLQLVRSCALSTVL